MPWLKRVFLDMLRKDVVFFSNRVYLTEYFLTKIKVRRVRWKEENTCFELILDVVSYFLKMMNRCIVHYDH